MPKLDGVDAEVVGLTDLGAMVLEPGKAGAWTGAMVSETGRVLATCDSSWPRQSAASQYADCSEEPRTMPVCVLGIGLIVPPA